MEEQLKLQQELQEKNFSEVSEVIELQESLRKEIDMLKKRIVEVRQEFSNKQTECMLHLRSFHEQVLDEIEKLNQKQEKHQQKIERQMTELRDFEREEHLRECRQYQETIDRQSKEVKELRKTLEKRDADLQACKERQEKDHELLMENSRHVTKLFTSVRQIADYLQARKGKEDKLTEASNIQVTQEGTQQLYQQRFLPVAPGQRQLTDFPSQTVGHQSAGVGQRFLAEMLFGQKIKDPAGLAWEPWVFIIVFSVKCGS